MQQVVQQVLCIHDWVPWYAGDSKVDSWKFKDCNFCKHRWQREEEEPRVVIGKVVESIIDTTPKDLE